METPTERNRRIFEEATARGEPVFVIRAKDVLAIAAVVSYGQLAEDVTSPAFLGALVELENDMHAWRNAHPEEIKTPDIQGDEEVMP